MESEIRVRALAALDPLFALRYSATHRNPYNVIDRLTPFDAYRQGLVKRIEVASVTEDDNANLPFIRVDDITTAKEDATCAVIVACPQKDRGDRRSSPDHQTWRRSR